MDATKIHSPKQMLPMLLAAVNAYLTHREQHSYLTKYVDAHLSGLAKKHCGSEAVLPGFLGMPPTRFLASLTLDLGLLDTWIYHLVSRNHASAGSVGTLDQTSREEARRPLAAPCMRCGPSGKRDYCHGSERLAHAVDNYTLSRHRRQVV